MSSGPRYVQVAVPTPLSRLFDYLLPTDSHATITPGVRVQVPFGRSRAVGVVMGLSHTTTVPAAKLKPVAAVIDAAPVLPRDLLELALWASRYYHHPVGEVLAALMPPAVRKGKAAADAGPRLWQLTESGRSVAIEALSRAPKQLALVERLQAAGEPVGEEELAVTGERWRDAMRQLRHKGWVECAGMATSAVTIRGQGDDEPLPLNSDQSAAVGAVCEALGRYETFLVDGVTGSGKTEVYLQVIQRTLARGEQALLLVPEIGLTPQLLHRFRARFPVPMVVLHSGLAEGQRTAAWSAAAGGQAAIVIGTRSAVFTPLARPGVIIVDEEHDGSFKQQEGFRYSARDLAVVRGRQAGIPVVLGSATPSLESLYNVEQGRYRRFVLAQRAGASATAPPRLSLLDIRGQPMRESLSIPLLQRMGEHVDAGGQVLVFLNRRGYAPTLICHGCGWVAECRRCDARMTYHWADQALRCHHCGAQRPVERLCPACGGSELIAVGRGTERLESALRSQFPQRTVSRIDRDTTRRKGALESLLRDAEQGRSEILVGTQMLAKGHHFPNITLVAILDADQGLFSADFRAGERMAQLILQVAGRAGRADRPGEVVIQTHHPHHPLLQRLINDGYAEFARQALEERRQAQLPPYSFMALLRAEAAERDKPEAFLAEVLALANRHRPAEVQAWGPVPAPMEKRAGRYRYHVLVQSAQRKPLHQLLDRLVPELETLPSARRVRWSLDVDPQELL